MSEGVAKRAKTMPVGEGNEKITIYKAGMRNEDIPKDDNVTKLVCHPSVTVIEEGAIQFRYMLKEVVLNEGLISIGENSFVACYSLTRIELPSTVTEVRKQAFFNCTNLKEVVLNEGLQKIGQQAFMGCKSLPNIKLPSTITEVGDYAFNHCTNLTEIILNEGLINIGERSFYGCELLTNIVIPSTVTEVRSRAFQNCDSLTEIILHEGLQKIGEEAFDDYLSLEHVKFPSISKRLKNLLESSYSEIQDKIANIQHFEWNGDALFISAEALRERSWCDDWDATKEHLDSILSWVSYYEMKEATSAIELAMWKARIEEMGAVTIEERNACRVEVPGPAKDAILQYLK